MILAPKFFLKGPPKFSTSTIKLSLLLIIVQNFMLISDQPMELGDLVMK